MEKIACKCAFKESGDPGFSHSDLFQSSVWWEVFKVKSVVFYLM